MATDSVARDLITKLTAKLDQQVKIVQAMRTDVDALKHPVVPPPVVVVPPTTPPTALSTTPPPVQTPTIVIKAGDNLLSILANAPVNAVIGIPPEFKADLSWWSLPKPVTLQSTLLSTLAPGRVSPALAGPLLNGLLDVTVPNVMFRGIRLQGHNPDGVLLTANKGASGMIFDRTVLLGNVAGQKRGLTANTSGVRVFASHIGDLRKDQDTQAVIGSMWTKDLYVEDCFLEASGENVLFGGEDGPSADSIPDGITFVNCDLFKPLSWMTKPGGLTAKNLFEIKNARNVVVRKCRMTNTWIDGQAGFAIVLTPRSQDGTAPWSACENVLFEDCQITNMTACVQAMGQDYRFQSGILTNIEFRRCDFRDVKGGYQFQMSRGSKGFRIVDCTFDGVANGLMSFEDPNFKHSGLEFRNSFMPSGTYGLKCPETQMGTPTIDLYAPGYVWSNMTIVGGDNNGVWPTGTVLVPVGTKPPMR